MNEPFDQNIFNMSKLINGIKGTIGNENDIYCPLPEYKDRYDKIDAHAIFAVAFAFSSENALNNRDNVLSSIGQYYSIYHLCFALITLDFSIKDIDLERIGHSTLIGRLKQFIERKIVSEDILSLFIDLKRVREHFNYLDMSDTYTNVGGELKKIKGGFGKIELIKKGYRTDFECFGTDSYYKICKLANNPLKKLLSNFFVILNEIELDVRSNSLTNGSRPEIFHSIRRYSDYEYYSEDMMINYFPENVLQDIDNFLGDHDMINNK